LDGFTELESSQKEATIRKNWIVQSEGDCNLERTRLNDGGLN
jgi:hypothetical protein